MCNILNYPPEAGGHGAQVSSELRETRRGSSCFLTNSLHWHNKQQKKLTNKGAQNSG